jgi:hypothetical protein
MPVQRNWLEPNTSRIGGAVIAANTIGIVTFMNTEASPSLDENVNIVGTLAIFRDATACKLSHLDERNDLRGLRADIPLRAVHCDRLISIVVAECAGSINIFADGAAPLRSR